MQICEIFDIVTATSLAKLAKKIGGILQFDMCIFYQALYQTCYIKIISNLYNKNDTINFFMYFIQLR